MSVWTNFQYFTSDDDTVLNELAPFTVKLLWYEIFTIRQQLSSLIHYKAFRLFIRIVNME